MCRAEAITRDDLILKWCYACGFYQWCRHEGGNYFCTNCGNRVQDWLTRLLYAGRRGAGEMVPETMAIDDKFQGRICPECGKLLCGDGFTSLERKIEVHRQMHKEEKDG